MSVPAIVTNWSGPTAYMDDSVGYPLPIDGLEEVPQEGGGAFAGGRGEDGVWRDENWGEAADAWLRCSRLRPSLPPWRLPLLPAPGIPAFARKDACMQPCMQPYTDTLKFACRRMHAGHRWARPSTEHLARLMRHVVGHRQEAAARGRAARRRMAAAYSPDAVAELVASELRRIEARLAP